MPAPAAVRHAPTPGDFTTSPRVVLLAAMAVAIGSAGVAAAWALLELIALCTNLAYAGRFSVVPVVPEVARLGWASVLIPVGVPWSSG